MICPTVRPHCAPNFPAFLGAEGQWRDMRADDSFFYSATTFVRWSNEILRRITGVTQSRSTQHMSSLNVFKMFFFFFKKKGLIEKDQQKEHIR